MNITIVIIITLIEIVIMKTFEVDEISLNLEIGKFYNVLGLLNAKPIFSNVSKGLSVQRMSIINIDRIQIIVEVWNSTQTSELTFSDDWQILQLIFIRDAKYRGVMKIGEGHTEFVHIFQISAKMISERFIWLSTPQPSFWEKPLLPHKFLLRHVSAEEIETIDQEVIILFEKH